MKKNIILCSVAAVLLVGGVVLIAPMFSDPSDGKKGSAGQDIDASLFDSANADAASIAEDPRGAMGYMFSDEYRGMTAAEKARYKDSLVEAMSDPMLEFADRGSRGGGDRGSRGDGQRTEGQRGQRTEGERGQRTEGERGERPEPTAEQIAAFEEMREVGERIQDARMKNFFAMSESDQNLYLDKRIERQEAWAQRRQEWIDRAKANPDDERSKRILSRMSGSTAMSGDTDQRVERSIARRQHSSPTSRAYREELSRRVDARRKELGLPKAPTTGGGGWGGGRGGR